MVALEQVILAASAQQPAHYDQEQEFKQIPCLQQAGNWSLELQSSRYTHSQWERLLLEVALGDVSTITAEPANQLTGTRQQ